MLYSNILGRIFTTTALFYLRIQIGLFLFNILEFKDFIYISLLTLYYHIIVSTN